MKKKTLQPIRLAAIAACFILVSAAEAQHGSGFRGGRGPHGDPSFAADRDTFHFLLESHDKIKRKVKLLDNGVQTLTTSTDAEVAARIQEHVAAMYSRLEESRPIRLRDPLFAELFRHADKVSMRVENVEDGVRVTETSADPYTVKLLQAHSGVVSAFVEHGFAEARKNHEVPGADANTVVLSKEQTGQLITLSAELDRVYIPALALTNQQKQKPSEAAIARLIAEAPAIADNAAAVLGHRPERWSTIGDAIEKAQQLVAEGELMEAHETLEPIRDQLLEERKGLALPYPVDLLNEYHVVMEEIVKPATKATPRRRGRRLHRPLERNRRRGLGPLGTGGADQLRPALLRVRRCTACRDRPVDRRRAQCARPAPTRAPRRGRERRTRSGPRNQTAVRQDLHGLRRLPNPQAYRGARGRRPVTVCLGYGSATTRKPTHGAFTNHQMLFGSFG